ncbi:hypothetical protein C2G38_2233020 [Gigaspora rosea]|uniref:Uncharacterized protein n=1 Tax=Gigaspora rosea TaxID=44941 RepID=A0A397TRJ9_9GLOM|nr:hypothetical protein C2G38_2233020 [Gigaspora rosea]
MPLSACQFKKTPANQNFTIGGDYDELERISRELQQLNNSLEDTLKIYANKISRPRPIYTTPRPTYYNYEEGYIVETSTRHNRHSYLPNRRRNLPNLKIVLKILENLIDGGRIVKNSDSIIPILYLSLDTQTPSTKKKSPVAPVKNFPSVKPCSKNRPKKLQKSRVKEETEYLSPYIKQTAPVKKNNQPQVYTLKPSSTKPGLKRPKERKPVNYENRYQNDVGASKGEGETSSIKDKKKAYPYCQKLAEISKQEVDESEQKRDEGITNEPTKSIKIIEDKALEENDKKMLVEVEGESKVIKNNDKLTKPLNGEALNHACER